VTSPNEVIYALDGQTGAKLWSYSKGNVLQSGPVVVNGMVYTGTGSGGAYAFGLGQPCRIAGKEATSAIPISDGVRRLPGAPNGVYLSILRADAGRNGRDSDGHCGIAGDAGG